MTGTEAENVSRGIPFVNQLILQGIVYYQLQDSEAPAQSAMPQRLPERSSKHLHAADVRKYVTSVATVATCCK